jgi:hypothetical protein
LGNQGAIRVEVGQQWVALVPYNIVRYEAVALADRRLFDQHHPTGTAIAAR